jgi:DNA repair exonuclease SbcCD ATPase subunit
LKVLHASDWHLGRTLYGKKRCQEYERFPDWLIETLTEHEIDLLSIPGDIFDTSIPSSRARELKSSRSRMKDITFQHNKARKHVISSLQEAVVQTNRNLFHPGWILNLRKRLEKKNREIKESLSQKQTLLYGARARYTQIEGQQVTDKSARQLELMSDSYLLIKDETRPIELNVIDTYQAGEIRSTKNLSGGESFNVSLSLALGLSSMAGRSIRVDSLFLDEGFGTLDEQASETALETLAVLQQEGKLIGIISHVGALKERISTRIPVFPGTGGKSVNKEPGCRGII